MAPFCRAFCANLSPLISAYHAPPCVPHTRGGCLLGGGLRSAQVTQDTRPFVSWPVSLIDFNLWGPITAEFQAPIPSSSSALRSEAARRRRFPPEAAGCVLCDALYCYVFSWFVWCPRRGHITKSHRITSDYHRFFFIFYARVTSAKFESLVMLQVLFPYCTRMKPLSPQAVPQELRTFQ